MAELIRPRVLTIQIINPMTKQRIMKTSFLIDFGSQEDVLPVAS